MSSVQYCSRTNSTLFTTCCECAICDDQSMCPVCGVEVIPRSSRGRHDVAMKSLYGVDAVQKMRKEWRKKDLDN